MKLGNPFTGAQLLRFGVVATLATGVLATAAGRGTLAYFTTQVTSTGNAFTAGTLHMNIADVDQAGALTTVGSSITFGPTMKPGDVVYAPIEIDNVGNLAAVYGITYSTTTTGLDLADGLDLAVKASGGGTGTKATVVADSAHACSAANWATGAVWTSTIQAGAGMVSGLTPQTVLGVSSDTSFGAADAVGRPLAATSGVETLCLRITFTEPGSGVNTYNNATNGSTNTTVLFTFDGLVHAGAVINNP
jgi:hypothetical protein